MKNQLNGTSLTFSNGLSLDKTTTSTYSKPYILCPKCNKLEKNPNSFFTLPNECQCPSPKTDLELLQDEVKSLTKKVNRLIKNQNK